MFLERFSGVSKVYVCFFCVCVCFFCGRGSSRVFSRVSSYTDPGKATWCFLGVL